MKGHKMNIQKISNRAIKSPASRKLSLNLTDLSPRSSNGTPLTSPKKKVRFFSPRSSKSISEPYHLKKGEIRFRNSV